MRMWMCCTIITWKLWKYIYLTATIQSICVSSFNYIFIIKLCSHYVYTLEHTAHTTTLYYVYIFIRRKVHIPVSVLLHPVAGTPHFLILVQYQSLFFVFFIFFYQPYSSCIQSTHSLPLSSRHSMWSSKWPCVCYQTV